jgi:hypothetical protein
MVSEDIRSLSKALRDRIDPVTGRLDLEPKVAGLVLDQIDVIHALVRFIERGVVPPAARLGGDRPDGVVDLAAARRRRQLGIVGGPAA